MVGRCHFLLGRPISRCYVSFREGIQPQIINYYMFQTTYSGFKPSTMRTPSHLVSGHHTAQVHVLWSGASSTLRDWLPWCHLPVRGAAGWRPFATPSADQQNHICDCTEDYLQGFSFKNVGAKQSTLISRLTKRSPPPRSVEEAMARSPRRLWGFLWKSGQKRGEHTRLGWSWYVDIGFVSTFVKIIDRYIHSTFL